MHSKQPGPAGQRITVLLADDHTIVRQGLRALLQAAPDIAIVGEAATGRQAVQLAKKLQPNVVVIDIIMPGLNGLEATRQITKQVPSVRMLILSSYDDEEYVQQLAEAGAVGFLLKESAAADLLHAIREVHKGKTCFCPHMSKRMLKHYRDTVLKGAHARSRVVLSSRETEVLQLIAEGRANKQIAAELNLSIKTVENHRQRLMNRLGIHDIASLTRYAVAKGIIKPEALIRSF